MSEAQVLQGGCLCGKIRYTITAASPGEAPDSICNYICHCTNCKKSSGGHMVNSSLFRQDQFSLTSGTPKCFKDSKTNSGGVISKYFCGDCGSPLYNISSSGEGFLAVLSGSLDDGSVWWKPNQGTLCHTIPARIQSNHVFQNYLSKESHTGSLNCP